MSTIPNTSNTEIPTNEIDYCKTCSTPLRGKFCYVCGQRKIEERFTLKNSLKSFVGVITNLDKGFLHTLLLMFTKPQKVLRDCLNGATVRYYHPFRYLFVLLTIQVLVMLYVIDMDQVLGGMVQPNNGNSTAQELQMNFTRNLMSYNHLMIAASLPILALSYWLMFGVKKYTYGEQLIITSYAYGHSVFIGIILSLAYLLNVNYVFLGGVSILVSLVYLFYVNLKFFKGNVMIIFLKTVVAFLMYITLFALVAVGLGVAFLLIKAAIDPEFVEQFKQASPTT